MSPLETKHNETSQKHLQITNLACLNFIKAITIYKECLKKFTEKVYFLQRALIYSTILDHLISMMQAILCTHLQCFTQWQRVNQFCRINFQEFKNYSASKNTEYRHKAIAENRPIWYIFHYRKCLFFQSFLGNDQVFRYFTNQLILQTDCIIIYNIWTSLEWLSYDLNPQPY